MKEDDKLIDAVLDLGLEIKGMRKEFTDEVKSMRKELVEMRKDMNHGLNELNHRVEKLEKHQQRTNLALGEMRLSYMKLDESFNKYALRNDERANNHETRMVRLEEKTSGGSYIAREPSVEYKRKKRK